MESTHIFAQRIKELREERGLAQGKLAEDLGISRGAVSYYEGCQRTPDITILSRFAAYFGVTADYLIGLSDNRTLENAGIGAETGLSDEAIQSIKQNKDNFFCSQGLNMIARDPLFCSMIAEYCFGQAAQFLSHSDYKGIPLVVSYLPELIKIKFAEIMEHLPRMRLEVEERYLDDFDFIDKLYQNYLSVYVDFPKYQDTLHVRKIFQEKMSQNRELTEEEEAEIDAICKEVEEEEEERFAEEMERMREAESKFLKMFESSAKKKRGRLNA